MQNHSNALLVVSDAKAVGTIAINAERLIGQHAAQIHRIHVGNQQDFFSPCTCKLRMYHAARLGGGIKHLVGVGARLDKFDLAAQCR